MAYFFGGYIPFPIGTMLLLMPTSGTSPTTAEITILSTACSGSGQFASLSSADGAIVSGYYGILMGFNVQKTVFTGNIYLVQYYAPSPYTPCLKLPFTNMYVTSNSTLYIFFAFTFGT